MKKQNKSSKKIFIVILLVAISGYFCAAKYFDFWPFEKAEQTTQTETEKTDYTAPQSDNADNETTDIKVDDDTYLTPQTPEQYEGQTETPNKNPNCIDAECSNFVIDKN